MRDPDRRGHPGRCRRHQQRGCGDQCTPPKPGTNKRVLVTGVRSYSEVGDGDLVSMAAKDPEAFGELFRRHSRAVYACCARRTGDCPALPAQPPAPSGMQRTGVKLGASSGLASHKANGH
jgi:hypothetical protein